MHLDDLPDLARARALRAAARGVAIRDSGRAVAVAFVSDGAILPADTLVRFDVTRGEDPVRRLSDAFATTGARAIWYFGGDDMTRRAVAALDLRLRPVGAAFVRRMDGGDVRPITFRAPSLVDRITLEELTREHAPDLAAPQVEVAEFDRDAVGMIFADTLENGWTELRAVVYPPHRGRGLGAALLAAAADRLEASGQRVCAAIEGTSGRARVALERAGFRLVDYYFIGKKGAAAP